MSMFENYENLSSTYIPNNQEKEIVTEEVFNNKLPKKEYDDNGNFIGYSWNYGDTVTIPYSVNKVIYVEEDAIIFENRDEAPSSSTSGVFGQKAYNISDLKCWVCNTLDQSIYEWVEQSKFTYPKNGTKPITIISDVDMTGKSVRFSIYNWRKEEVYSTETNGMDYVNIIINEELSKKLIKGLYTGLFTIVSNGFSKADESIVLLVKSEDNAYDMPSLGADVGFTLEDLLQGAVEKYLKSHPMPTFTDDGFDEESDNPPSNSTVTKKIFGVGGIDESISNLNDRVNSISSENLSVDTEYFEKLSGDSLQSVLINTDGNFKAIDDNLHTLNKVVPENADEYNTLVDRASVKRLVREAIGEHDPYEEIELATSDNYSIDSDTTAATPACVAVISDSLSQTISIDGVAYDSKEQALIAVAQKFESFTPENGVVTSINGEDGDLLINGETIKIDANSENTIKDELNTKLSLANADGEYDEIDGFYVVGDLVMHDSKLYRCLGDVDGKLDAFGFVYGPWDETYWEEESLIELLNSASNFTNRAKHIIDVSNMVDDTPMELSTTYINAIKSAIQYGQSILIKTRNGSYIEAEQIYQDDCPLDNSAPYKPTEILTPVLNQSWYNAAKSGIPAYEVEEIHIVNNYSGEYDSVWNGDDKNSGKIKIYRKDKKCYISNELTEYFDYIKAPIYSNYLFAGRSSTSSVTPSYVKFANLVCIDGMEKLSFESTTTMAGMFNGCSLLERVNGEFINTNNVASTSNMFRDCRNLKLGDTNETNMNEMFKNFDMSNVTDMSYMFYECGLYKLDAPNWKTGKVQSFGYTFCNAYRMTELVADNWDMRNVRTTSCMFQNGSFTTSRFKKNFNPIWRPDYFCHYYTDKLSKANTLGAVFEQGKYFTINSNNSISSTIYVEVHTKPTNFGTSKDSTTYYVHDNNGTECNCLCISMEKPDNWETDYNVSYYIALSNARPLTHIDTRNWRLHKCQTLNAMFWGCGSLKSLAAPYDATVVESEDYNGAKYWETGSYRATHFKPNTTPIYRGTMYYELINGEYVRQWEPDPDRYTDYYIVDTLNDWEPTYCADDHLFSHCSGLKRQSFDTWDWGNFCCLNCMTNQTSSFRDVNDYIDGEKVVVNDGCIAENNDYIFEVVSKDGYTGLKSINADTYLGVSTIATSTSGNAAITVNGWNNDKHITIKKVSDYIFRIVIPTSQNNGLSVNATRFTCNGTAASNVYLFKYEDATDTKASGYYMSKNAPTIGSKVIIALKHRDAVYTPNNSPIEDGVMYYELINGKYEPCWDTDAENYSNYYIREFVDNYYVLPNIEHNESGNVDNYVLGAYDMTGWDTSHVMVWDQMYETYNSYATRIDGLNTLDTSSARDYREMFRTSYSVRELDLTTFDTSNLCHYNQSEWTELKNDPRERGYAEDAEDQTNGDGLTSMMPAVQALQKIRYGRKFDIEEYNYGFRLISPRAKNSVGNVNIIKKYPDAEITGDWIWTNRPPTASVEDKAIWECPPSDQQLCFDYVGTTSDDNIYRGICMYSARNHYASGNPIATQIRFYKAVDGSNEFELTNDITNGIYVFGGIREATVHSDSTLGIANCNHSTSNWLLFNTVTPSNGKLTVTNQENMWEITRVYGHRYTFKNVSTEQYLSVSTDTGAGSVKMSDSKGYIYLKPSNAQNKTFTLHALGTSFTKSYLFNPAEMCRKYDLDYVELAAVGSSSDPRSVDEIANYGLPLTLANWSQSVPSEPEYIEKPYINKWGYISSVKDGTTEIYDWFYRCLYEAETVPTRTIQYGDNQQATFTTDAGDYNDYYFKGMKLRIPLIQFGWTSQNLAIRYLERVGRDNAHLITYGLSGIKLVVEKVEGTSIIASITMVIARRHSDNPNDMTRDVMNADVYNQITPLTQKIKDMYGVRPGDFLTDDQKKKITKVIHDWIILHSEYRSEANRPEIFTRTPYLEQTYYPSLSSGKVDTVCAGYAMAMQFVCDLYGIFCVYVEGSTANYYRAKRVSSYEGTTIPVWSESDIYNTGDKVAANSSTSAVVFICLEDGVTGPIDFTKWEVEWENGDGHLTHAWNMISYELEYGTFTNNKNMWTALDATWDDKKGESDDGVTWTYFLNSDKVYAEPLTTADKEAMRENWRDTLKVSYSWRTNSSRYYSYPVERTELNYLYEGTEPYIWENDNAIDASDRKSSGKKWDGSLDVFKVDDDYYADMSDGLDDVQEIEVTLIP